MKMTVLKKVMAAASVILTLTAIAQTASASFWFFNQPKTPKMLK